MEGDNDDRVMKSDVSGESWEKYTVHLASCHMKLTTQMIE
jgi:hypothetical protein